jgi:FkbM family methyltransferase
MMRKKKSPMNINNFEWDPKDSESKRIISKEIFQDRVYEKFCYVKENDIVMDIGSNVGAFTYSILDKKPKRVYCVEPSNSLIDILWRNTRSEIVTYINKAICDEDNEKAELKKTDFIYNHTGTFKSTTFKNLLKKHDIQKIDFMKIDCEGGEYSIFNEKNRDFLLNKVKHIAGEWHLSDIRSFESGFRKFRDLYLRNHKNYFISAKNAPDVTTWVYDENYINWYSANLKGGAQFMVYITNEVK